MAGYFQLWSATSKLSGVLLVKSVLKKWPVQNIPNTDFQGSGTFLTSHPRYSICLLKSDNCCNVLFYNYQENLQDKINAASHNHSLVKGKVRHVLPKAIKKLGSDKIPSLTYPHYHSSMLLLRVICLDIIFSSLCPVMFQ